MPIDCRIEGQEAPETRRVLTFALEQREEGLCIVAKETDGDVWPLVAITSEGKMKRFADIDPELGLELNPKGQVLMLRD